MRIGIFGGTFNPIHIGHMNIADCAVHDAGLNWVLFIPSKNPYTKPNIDMATYHCRTMMTAIAISNERDRFDVCEDFIKDGEPTYTYLTVKKLKESFSSDDLFLILGEDAFLDFKSWKNYKDILEDIKGFYVYPRGKNSSKQAIKDLMDELKLSAPNLDLYMSLDAHELDISSTIIRDRIDRGLTCKYLLPEGVYQYILNHKLYK